jgi:arginyl-tRNA synthetase
MSHVVAIKEQMEAAVTTALASVLPSDIAETDPLVRRSEHADFQSNAPLALAKKAGRSPRDLAIELSANLADLIATEVSGPGFLNLTVSDRTILENIASRLADDRLGVGCPRSEERVVIDYSAPNVAKEMHVGHLRSTIIGDTLTRILDYLGATVIRQNHVGDWGTQFGMLIQYLCEHPEAEWHGDGSMAALDALYRTARKEFESDLAFADRARARVVALQMGDSQTLGVWRELVDESQRSFQAMYERLGVLLTADDFDGESRYNDALPAVVDELLRAGVAHESEGAVVTFVDGVTNAEGDPVPLIIRKSDGGYGYGTTDLATIRFRVDEYKADRVLYVVDARQSLHFRMVFDAARRAGWLPDHVQAIHVPFGTVLGNDGKPFKTRAGGTVRLSDLLDEAVARAHNELAGRANRAAGLDDAELDGIASAVGVGAVKYADLSNNRVNDYVFDVDKMVTFTGNTGVYLQYAHARVRSILRRAEAEGIGPAATDITITLEPAERALALALDEYEQTLCDVAETLEPHRLCGYIIELSRAYTDFYESCPVLRAADATIRANRLALCELTGRTLSSGLQVLGIEAPDRL